MEAMDDVVREHFHGEAERYDALIPRLIPRYAEQGEALLDSLPFAADARLRVADLGCGTGALSELVLKRFPNATVRAFDLAPGMVDASRERLERFGERFTCQQADFASGDIGSGYDAIVSGLAIHHLAPDEQRALYVGLYAALVPGGVFAHREIVVGETEHETERFHDEWRAYIRSQGEDDAAWFARYVIEDRPVPLSSHLQWLRFAGFEAERCVWQHLNFVVITATRPG